MVFLDYDFDGILDANEPSARTNQFGEYELTSTRDFFDLVAIADDQTVDTSSGAIFAGITLKGLNVKGSTPSGNPSTAATSLAVRLPSFIKVDVGDITPAPDGAFNVIPAKIAPDDVSTV